MSRVGRAIGRKPYVLREVGWYRHPKIRFKTWQAKLAYDALWDTARDELQRTLPPTFDAPWLADAVLCGTTPEDMEKALAELCKPWNDGKSLISIDDEGCITVHGIKKVNKAVTSWRDVGGEPEGRDEEEAPAPAMPEPPAKKKAASPKKANRAKKEFVDSVINNWNAFAEKHGYACVRLNTQTIRRKIATRSEEDEWQGDYWPAMLARLETLNPHYRGEGSTGWKTNLGFLVRDDSKAQSLLKGEWSAAPKTREGYTDDEARERMDALERQIGKEFEKGKT